jgi:hypothetical protein
VQLNTSDFGFQMQESSNPKFRISAVPGVSADSLSTQVQEGIGGRSRNGPLVFDNLAKNFIMRVFHDDSVAAGHRYDGMSRELDRFY